MKNKFKKFTSALLALVMLCGVLAVAPVAVHAEELQVYENRKGGTFSFDPGTGELKLLSGSFYGESWQKWGIWDTDLNFARSEIKSVVAEEGVKFTGSCNQMFLRLNNSEGVTVDLSKVDTSEVVGMQYMFQEATGIKTLDLSGFDTSKVKNMAGMFRACEQMTVLKINKDKFKTGEVDNMYQMFMGCSQMTSLDLSGFDTQKVTNMESMFEGCKSLISLDLSNFKTSKVTSTKQMFLSCGKLTSLDLSNFTISDTTNIDLMFSSCTNLKELTISDKFAGGIKGTMKLTNGENNNGWRIKGDPTAAKVSEYDSTYMSATITNPEYLPGKDETKTYIWIGYYDVDWLNEDGTKMSREQYKVDADTHPTYKGATPINPDPEDTTSVFVGWVDDLGNEYGVNDELPAVTRDTTYTARFEAPKTEYTLNYIYQGRSGGNNGAYVGDDGATDEKTYTVTVELGDSDLKESGMPKDKVLVDNAPVVNDPYKNCRWTIDDEHVIFDPGTKIVTITAEQPERKYSVVFKNSNNETTDVFRVKLNDFVKKNDSFITAEETDGSGTKFAYWSVVQNNKEVARCFERKFNLRVTGDSVVTANYGEAENLISLSDAEITRQPIYQNGIPKDCLYADFITAYMDKQGMELSKKSSSEYKTGLILQYNKEILVKENEPGATLNANDKITFGSDYELTAADAKTIADGETVSGKYSYKSISIDNSKYNDKNRLNKALPIENTELNRRMVYCAYYYVYNVKAGKIEMTAPVYFYLYDKGNEINTEN